jgi:shikimate kinase
MKNVVFIGFMGSGKTTVGRRVATALGMDFYDTDEYIKKCEKMSANEVMRKKGAQYFRGAETFAVQNLIYADNALISTGGATMMNDKNRELLKKNSVIVWLNASAQTVYDNTRHSHNKRLEIAGLDVEGLARLLEERKRYYQACDVEVSVDSRDIDAIVDDICRRVKALR